MYRPGHLPQGEFAWNKPFQSRIFTTFRSADSQLRTLAFKIVRPLPRAGPSLPAHS